MLFINNEDQKSPQWVSFLCFPCNLRKYTLYADCTSKQEGKRDVVFLSLPFLQTPHLYCFTSLRRSLATSPCGGFRSFPRVGKSSRSSSSGLTSANDNSRKQSRAVILLFKPALPRSHWTKMRAFTAAWSSMPKNIRIVYCGLFFWKQWRRGRACQSSQFHL